MMTLKFVKAYNVTKLVGSKKEILFSYQDAGYERVYIAKDTNDMHIYRILKDYNEEYEKEEGAYLVEREKISNYDVAEKLIEMGCCTNKYLNNKIIVDELINSCKLEEVFLATLLIDDNNGLENWDNCECCSMEEAIDVIDGGYGVIEEWKN